MVCYQAFFQVESQPEKLAALINKDMEQVKLSEATKAKDWKCTSRFNAGTESSRDYTSESAGEYVIVDGKNENYVLNILRAIPFNTK